MLKTKLQKKSWRRVKIKDLGNIVTGKTPPTKNSKYYNGKYPFITPTDILENSIYVKSPERYLSESGAEKIKSSRLPQNSICYTCIASIGKIAITKKDSFSNQQINSVIVDPQKNDFRFIFYLLKNITAKIKRFAGGAASPIINKSTFSDIEVSVPSLQIQKQIADILSTYDDLIENNNRRIETLEEMAQAIYKEWFVDFRFPGHEKVKFVDSGTEFGKIPEGWEVKKLDDYVDFVRGIEPGSKNYKEKFEENLIPFLRVGNLGSRQSNIFIDKNLAKDKILLKDDIAISLDGTVGIVKIGMYGAYSTGIRKIVIEHNTINKPFIWQLMQSDFIQNIIKENAKGTTILHASESIKYMEFILPRKKIMQMFYDASQSIMDEILNLSGQNEQLRRVRDLLLPKLINGEIEV
jgi:type I restriction enzyme S subunit